MLHMATDTLTQPVDTTAPTAAVTVIGPASPATRKAIAAINARADAGPSHPTAAQLAEAKRNDLVAAEAARIAATDAADALDAAKRRRDTDAATRKAALAAAKAIPAAAQDTTAPARASKPTPPPTAAKSVKPAPATAAKPPKVTSDQPDAAPKPPPNPRAVVARVAGGWHEAVAVMTDADVKRARKAPAGWQVLQVIGGRAHYAAVDVSKRDKTRPFACNAKRPSNPPAPTTDAVSCPHCTLLRAAGVLLDTGAMGVSPAK